MVGPADPVAIRQRYGVPEAVELRASPREVLGFLPGFEDVVRAVAEAPDALPRAARAGRAPLSRLDSPLGSVLVREYRKGGLLRHVRGRRFLGPWRPFVELSLARRLLAARVPVVEAVGAVVLRGWTGWRGFLLTLEVPGGLDLEAYLYDPAAHPEWPLRDALAEAGRTVRALHDAGVAHGDLHPKNLLLDPSAAAVRALDLDRSGAFDAPLDDDARVRNLTRLARSVEKHRLRGMPVGRREALRFLRAYGGGAEPGDRWLAVVRASVRRGLWLHRAWWRLSGQVGRARGPATGGGGAPHRVPA